MDYGAKMTGSQSLADANANRPEPLTSRFGTLSIGFENLLDRLDRIERRLTTRPPETVSNNKQGVGVDPMVPGLDISAQRLQALLQDCQAVADKIEQAVG